MEVAPTRVRAQRAAQRRGVLHPRIQVIYIRHTECDQHVRPRHGGPPLAHDQFGARMHRLLRRPRPARRESRLNSVRTNEQPTTGKPTQTTTRFPFITQPPLNQPTMKNRTKHSHATTSSNGIGTVDLWMFLLLALAFVYLFAGVSSADLESQQAKQKKQVQTTEPYQLPQFMPKVWVGKY